MNTPSFALGSCLCGKVTYEVRSRIKATTHCHCRMCQKAHGAAFATYGSVPLGDFWIGNGSELMATYESSPGVIRRFCTNCGSTLTWQKTQGTHADWISIALGTLDTPFQPEKIREVNKESAPAWCQLLA
ncbi:GFA family protein [Diaphorobacter sp. HDW4B]|uniref:GFA family protein n=1 Tax=Diaphorobacter sp. HDW4B TaxID=2714925 RepID=UPI001409C369|nr:GFA family protein [Diaphorobacter sp. HDW4B]QIL70853.1 GFA family protein [Diaphorobacter sp. HDW4B]